MTFLARFVHETLSLNQPKGCSTENASRRESPVDCRRTGSGTGLGDGAFGGTAELAVVRALLRAGRHEEANELLDTITPDMPMQANPNLAYYHDLLFYKSLMTAEELLSVGDNGPQGRVFSPLEKRTPAQINGSLMLNSGPTQRTVA